MTTLRSIAALAVALLYLAWLLARLLVCPPRIAMEIGGRGAGFVRMSRRDVLAFIRATWPAIATTADAG